MKFKYLLHPVVLLALFLTAVNDHYLKYTFSNFITGKLSDFAGIFYFPFFLYAIIDLLINPKAITRTIVLKKFIIVLLVTDLFFIFFKFTFFKQMIADIFSNYLFNIQIVSDLTDLSALIMNYFSYLLAQKFTKPIE